MSQQTNQMELSIRREQENVQKLVGRIADLVNGTSTKMASELFYRGFINQHRTLQEMMWKMLLEVIAMYAECEWYDDRNEAAVKSCKAMKQFMLENPEKFYLPVI